MCKIKSQDSLKTDLLMLPRTCMHLHSSVSKKITNIPIGFPSIPNLTHLAIARTTPSTKNTYIS